jgi:HemY protein
MRWLIGVLLLLLLAVGVAVGLQQGSGYVYLELGQWVVETSAVFLLASLVVLFVALYALVRLVGWLWRSPRRWRRGSRGRRAQRSRRSLTRGLIEMAEGRWVQAEKILTRDAPASDTALLNYLAAARAAQQTEAYDRRDGYLKAAIEANPDADVAVSLTQAELQLAHRQTEQALATLNRLRGLAPQHSYALKLLARLYTEQKDWERLADLLAELRRRRVLERTRLDQLERAAALGRFEAAEAREAALRTIWDSLSRGLREDPAIVHAYATRLAAAGAVEAAEKRLRHTLDRRWDEALARDYGRIRTNDAAHQLGHAQNWLRDHGRSPMLLLTLGRLSARNGLWGKARDYFESSLNAEPHAETYYAFAQVLDELGELGAAHEQYRAGLAQALAPGEGVAVAARTQATAAGVKALPGGAGAHAH